MKAKMGGGRMQKAAGTSGKESARSTTKRAAPKRRVGERERQRAERGATVA